MEYVALALDTISVFWAVGVYLFLLFFSVFLFDSPYATQFGAWTTFMTMVLMLDAIPLAWWAYRLWSGGWFKTTETRTWFAVIAAAIFALGPFLYWNSF